MSPSKSTGSDKHQAYHEEAPLRRAYDGKLLRRVWAFVAPHRTLVVVSLSTLVLLSVAGLVRPLVMGNVAKHASDGNADLLLRDGVILALMAVAMQTMTFAQTYSMQLAGARSMADLRSAIFAHLQRMRLRYFDRTPIGRLVTRATNDVDGLNELFASGVLNALGDVIALGGIIAMMIALHWRMAIIAFMALPFVAIIVLVTRGKAREAYRAIRTRTARLNAFINEQVSGIAVVQAFAREQAMAEEFDEINAAYRDANKASVFFEAIVDAAIEMVGTLCVASVLWWAGLKNLQHGDDTVTFALVVTFTQYIKQFFEPISLLSQRYTVLQSAMSGAERIFELLDDPDVEPLPREAEQADASRLHGDEALAFEDVTFEYKPGVPVLQQVSLKARRGERIALVGATGAGKTTVASLCLRLYEVTSGDIRVLGRSVAAYAPRELRQLFSVVPQDVYLFPGTVLSNVAVSDAEPDRAKAEAALARIGALEFFLRREGGLDARVEERGSNFSAGERQLLAFARAVYKHAPLVILDEATASVDSATEAQLQRALDALLAGCTSIVIAHRLSTIRSADRIVVFHKGRIVEQGSHEELLAHGGVYAKLHRLQFAREEADEEQARPHHGASSFRSPVRVEA